MLLENKVAMIYGAGGSIGGAVAHAFAREGAQVFLAGRTQASLDEVADEIHSNGGIAETAIVDALDEQAVENYVDVVVKQAGQIDISFNLVSYGDVQMPLLELSVEDFMQPIKNAMQAHFLTTRAAARHMVKRGSGVILAFGGGDRRLCRAWENSRSRWTPLKDFVDNGQLNLGGRAYGWSQ
jgi:3-oxoacyl-[acyl-carrier protein] reductase